MAVEKHFTVSIYIVHKDKVLLHVHKKYGMLLPLGGHIEANELPEEACIREAKEESGLIINLYNADSNNPFTSSIEESIEKSLLRPMHMILCEVNPEHYHIDLNYYATADSYNVDPLDGESNLLYWYTREELSKVQNAPHDVIVMANEALELLSQK